MSDKQTFNVVLEKHESMEATGITIPFDVEKVFGAKRVPVKVSINGVDHRSTVVTMGGKYCMIVPKVFREAAGVKAGDNIVVTMEHDLEERTIIPPDDLAEALRKNKAAQEAWSKLSYTHKKEHAAAIEEAKKPETRIRRIEKSIEMLTAGKRK